MNLLLLTRRGLDWGEGFGDEETLTCDPDRGRAPNEKFEAETDPRAVGV